MSTSSLRRTAAASFFGIGQGNTTPVAAVVLAAAKPKADDDEDGEAGKAKEPDAGKAPEKAAKPARGKKAKGESDDDEGCDCDPDEDEDCDCDEHEMKGDSAAAVARRRERARCAAIFAHPAAARNIDFAAHLAFSTTQTKAEALRAMEAAPAASGGLSARMSQVGKPNLGPGGERDGASAAAAVNAGWDRGMKLARGDKSRA